MTALKILKEDAEKEWVTFFRGREGGFNFHIKNKLKPEINNDKKSL